MFQEYAKILPSRPGTGLQYMDHRFGMSERPNTLNYSPASSAQLAPRLNLFADAATIVFDPCVHLLYKYRGRMLLPVIIANDIVFARPYTLGPYGHSRSENPFAKQQYRCLHHCAFLSFLRRESAARKSIDNISQIFRARRRLICQRFSWYCTAD